MKFLIHDYVASAFTDNNIDHSTAQRWRCSVNIWLRGTQSIQYIHLLCSNLNNNTPTANGLAFD